uniref:Uncharacterized protein n=2 Tax=Caenorhabditis japonica TaxID=281687 RepID=A0A8R1IXR9_CAEJA
MEFVISVLTPERIHIGPYGAVTKLLGCAIESFLVLQTFGRKSDMVASESSVQQRRPKKFEGATTLRNSAA